MYVITILLNNFWKQIMRSLRMKSNKKFTTLLSLMVLLFIAFGFTSVVEAALPTSSIPTAQISFTFDDSLASTYFKAAPILAKYNLSGTDYAITGCMGMSTIPNNCRANTSTPYMSWAQLQELQNTYGWEIGSHTEHHNCLASSRAQDPSDCQARYLTSSQLSIEIAGSKNILATYGINATDFAPPYGDFNNNVISQIAKSYATMRQFKNASNNSNIYPYSDYYLQNYQVLEVSTSVSTIETQINNAIANHQWLILAFHNISDNPSHVSTDYQYGSAELDQIAAYVQSKQASGVLNSVHINKGITTSTTNLLTNGNFASGISEGWTTDGMANIKADSLNNGSFPDPTHSIKFNSVGTNTHLFSPKISVNPSTTYTLKNFLNVLTNKSEIGYYIDEYDSNGNWISGQYKSSEKSAFVENINFNYTPSSVNVSFARLQIIISGGVGTSGYLANSQWFPISTKASNNLMPNSSFDNGLASGWTTDDPSNILPDANNNGSTTDPVNSVKLISSIKNTHLFSPSIAVSSVNSYAVSAYLNIQQINSGSVVGFYVDEYDASGNWISGQYKLSANTIGLSIYNFGYTPSSSNVAKASVQIILVANSNTSAYLDDVTFSQQ